VCNTFLSHSKRTKSSDKEKEKDACISCTSHGLESFLTAEIASSYKAIQVHYIAIFDQAK
jgi:hypothetical protein